MCKLSKFKGKPSNQHWKVITRVLGYLKKTINLELHYSDYVVVLEGYSNASWITDMSDNKSNSGWIFTIDGAVIS